jgi:uncharacterized membrane protein YvbJ
MKKCPVCTLVWEDQYDLCNRCGTCLETEHQPPKEYGYRGHHNVTQKSERIRKQIDTASYTIIVLSICLAIQVGAYLLTFGGWYEKLQEWF